LLQQQGFAAATGTGLPMAAQLSATAVVLSLHLMAVQGNNPHAAPVWHCRGLRLAMHVAHPSMRVRLVAVAAT